MNIFKSSTVVMDEKLAEITGMFDYRFDGTTEVSLGDTDDLPDRDGKWSLGVIVGASGSGKSSMAMEKYGFSPLPTWEPSKAVVSQVDHRRLSAVGFNSIRSWCKPRHVLSTGEGFRADAAASLKSDACLDEWTSVVDRDVAVSCSNAAGKYIKKFGLRGVVLVTCHRDIIPWLSPDWVYDTSKGLEWHASPAPEIILSIERCKSSEWWPLFSNHHYLDGGINPASECYLAKWGDRPVGFSASLSFPSGSLKQAYRSHRLVVLPEFQGLGIGVRLSEHVARLFLDRGKRYFVKTSHPRLGEYHDHSHQWRPTSKNRKDRKDYGRQSVTKESGYKHLHKNRVCYSHEFVGDFNEEAFWGRTSRSVGLSIKPAEETGFDEESFWG